MIKLWRGLAASALVTGLAMGAQAAPAFAASHSAPRVTIGASSYFQPVGRYVYVEYQDPRLQLAHVRGRVSGAARGDKIELYSQEFPYNTPYALAATHTAHSRSARYSFDVRPGLATRYRVELFSKSGTKLVTSAQTTVYVTPDVVAAGGPGPCHAHRCTTAVMLQEYFPTTAGSTEEGKRVYPYAGLITTSVPRWLYRNAERARVSTSVVSTNEVNITIRFTWRYSGKRRPSLDWIACTKDTLAKDGMGLPGHHGCGAKRVRSNVRYLG